MIKLGLIGLGRMGQNHLRNLSILKSVEIIFIYDSNTEVMHQMAAQFGVPACSNLEGALSKVDAVVIVTPTSTHAEYVQLASKQVKSIFVEKPFAQDYQTTSELVGFSKQNHLNVQVGFIERFNPVVVELKKILDEKRSAINIDFVRTNKMGARITDVDVVQDMMIHDLDLALYINGPAQLISSYGVVDQGSVAFARAVLQHDSGVFSNILASRMTEKRIRHICVTADEYFIDCNLLQKELLVNKQSNHRLYDQVQMTSIEETVLVPQGEALLGELLAFVNSASLNDFSNVPGVDAALHASKLADEITTSIMRQYETVS